MSLNSALGRGTEGGKGMWGKGGRRIWKLMRELEMKTNGEHDEDKDK
jgi:hypothetical protein